MSARWISARRLPLGSAVLLCALLTVPAAAQPPTAPPTPPEATPSPVPERVFVDTVEVEVVNIDVYVRDSDGRPIEGLRGEDFELFVDGKPTTITNFYAVSGRSRPAVSDRSRSATPRVAEEPATATPAAPAPTTAGTAPAKGAEPAPTPKEQSLLIVIYIDNYNLTPFRRNMVLRELRQFLRDAVTPDDRVMLATYDRSLNLREPFSARPENIARALLEIESISAQRLHSDRERGEILRRMEDADTAGDSMQMAANFAASERNDLEFTLRALRSVVDSLAASSGRKALVYVSEGLALIPAQDLFQAAALKWKEEVSLNEMYQFDMSLQFQELANQANANRVSFYTVDAGGLRVWSQGTVDPEIAGQAGEGQLIDSVKTTNMQAPIQLLAERTGGRAIINTNRFLPDLLKIRDDFRNYYSIGYTSGEVGDGTYHRFEVKLKKKIRGATLRHRDGYRSKSIETRMHDGTLSALRLDLQDNPLEARLESGAPQADANGLFRVPFRITIPYSSLTLIPRNAVHHGQLHLWLAAQDQDEEMSDVQQVPVELALSDQDLAQRDYVFSLELTMEAGHHNLAVGVRDEFGHRQSFLRVSLAVGQPSL